MIKIKGYHSNIGYFGWVEPLKDYLLFATERDYIEWINEYSNMKNREKIFSYNEE